MRVCVVVYLTTLCAFDGAQGTFGDFLYNLPNKVMDAFSKSWGTVQRVLDMEKFNYSEEKRMTMRLKDESEISAEKSHIPKKVTRNINYENETEHLDSDIVIFKRKKNTKKITQRKKKLSVQPVETKIKPRPIELPIFTVPKSRFHHLWRTESANMFAPNDSNRWRYLLTGLIFTPMIPTRSPWVHSEETPRSEEIWGRRRRTKLREKKERFTFKKSGMYLNK